MKSSHSFTKNVRIHHSSERYDSTISLVGSYEKVVADLVPMEKKSYSDDPIVLRHEGQQQMVDGKDIGVHGIRSWDFRLW